MKILIAYDGSDSADTAIDGLQRAGLPVENVESLIMAVGEVWLPPPARDEVLDDTFPLQIPPGLKQARAHAAEIAKHAQDLAASVSERVSQIFPRWTVE